MSKFTELNVFDQNNLVLKKHKPDMLNNYDMILFYQNLELYYPEHQRSFINQKT